MKNNKRILGLLTVLFTLAGCKAVQETFDKNAFHSNDFQTNYYSYMPSNYKNNNYTEKGPNRNVTYVEHEVFGNVYDTIIAYDIALRKIEFADAVKFYGNDAAKTLFEEGATKEEVESELRKSENATFYKYAKRNSLSDATYLSENVRESFKQGVFSKLTDGDVTCRGDGALSRVQIPEEGFGKVFDHELLNYRSLIISLRGGTNIDDESLISLGKPRPTRAKVLLKVAFYIEKSPTNEPTKYNLEVELDDLFVDNNTRVNIINIDLSYLYLVISENSDPYNGLTRTSGISISFELLEHDIIKPAGEEENSDFEFALMLYEFMLPYSVWR